MGEKISRRDFLRLADLLTKALLLAACAPEGFSQPPTTASNLPPDVSGIPVIPNKTEPLPATSTVTPELIATPSRPEANIDAFGGSYPKELWEKIQAEGFAEQESRLQEFWRYWSGAANPAVAPLDKNEKMQFEYKFNPENPADAYVVVNVRDRGYQVEVDGKQVTVDYFSVPFYQGKPVQTAPGQYVNGEIETGQGPLFLTNNGRKDASGDRWYLSAEYGLPVRRSSYTNRVAERINPDGRWANEEQMHDYYLAKFNETILPGEPEKLTIYSEAGYSGLDILDKGQAWRDFLAPMQAYFNRNWRAALDMPNDTEGIIKWLREHDYKTPMKVQSGDKEEWFKMLQGSHWGSGFWEPNNRNNLGNMQMDWKAPKVWMISAQGFNNDWACRAKLNELEQLNGNFTYSMGWWGKSSFGSAAYAEGLLFDVNGLPIFVMSNNSVIGDHDWMPKVKKYQFGGLNQSVKYQGLDEEKAATALYLSWVFSNINYNRDEYWNGEYSDITSWSSDVPKSNAFWVEDVTEENRVFVSSQR
jgi:hypothetical protein